MSEYKRIDDQALIFLVNYLFTKLKNSPLAANTTYTLEKQSNKICLKDADGTIISQVTDDNTTYSLATDSAQGLLSAADFTKLKSIASGAQANVIEDILVNGVQVTVTDKKASFSVITASEVDSLVAAKGYQTAAQVEQIVTGKGYQTASQVNSAIANAIADSGHITKQIVDVLPSAAAAQENVIYMVSNGNGYDEYMKVNNTMEKIGSTDIDLSGYVQRSEMKTVTNTEMETIVDNAYTAVFG